MSKKKNPAQRGVLLQAHNAVLVGLNPARLQAFRPLLDLKADSLAFGQRLEAAAFDGGEVHEHIFTAIGRGDKAKALGFVKPLNGTCSHVDYLYKKITNMFNHKSWKVMYRRYNRELLKIPNHV